MRNRLLGAAVGCALAFGAGGAVAGECSGTISADEALKAEDARYAAQTSGDFAAMDRLFGDDLRYTHSSGKSDGKASYIELQRSKAVVYRRMQRSNVVVRTYGCIAIITGDAHYQVTVNGKDTAAELVFHSIWAKRDGGAQFISWQSTPAPKP
jgi:hypothetical protein